MDDWTIRSDDPVVRELRKLGIPVTRENYIELAYFGEPPKELGVEQEAELPQQLQQKGTP